MCTNSARLVNSLECYMDDLVDCFEDFVKKSLLIISVAVGAVILMLGYALKIVSDRASGPVPIRENTTEPNSYSVSPKASDTSIDYAERHNKKRGTKHQKSVNNVAMSLLKEETKNTTSAGANTGPISSVPSLDEKVLRNIGLATCSKGCMQGKRSLLRNGTTPKTTIPCTPNCVPNHHLSTPRPCSKYVISRNSCCSMCCDDDDRR